ncbi:hypothetical protein [Rhodanobacter geophilus]|uniref:Uncharacterized protein n=1 Tax=Rhodanobacter geophilus TaxID=3162488 RepID=A0ABV3QQT6_9GAMM
MAVPASCHYSVETRGKASFVALFRLQVARFAKLLDSERQAGCIPAYYLAPGITRGCRYVERQPEMVCHRQAEIGASMIARPDCLSVNNSQMVRAMVVIRPRTKD